MKISNNALNFLLAQYRAIFKRAYVKGIASAVLLTAGLAAGQGQAGQITDINTILDAENDAFEVDGTDDYLSLTLTEDKTLNKNVIVNIGGTESQYIRVSGTGAGKVIALDGAGHNLTIQDDGSSGKKKKFIFGTNATADKLQIRNLGTLTIDGVTVEVKVKDSQNKQSGVDIGANNISITNGAQVNILNGSGTNANEANAILRGRNMEISGEETVVNVGNTALIGDASTKNTKAVLGWQQFKAEDDTVDYEGSNIKVTDATINLTGIQVTSAFGTGADGYHPGYTARVAGKSFTADNARIVVSGGASGGAMFEVYETALNNSVLDIKNGVVLNFEMQEYSTNFADAKETKDANINYNGTASITGGLVKVDGALMVTRGGTLKIADDVALTAAVAETPANKLDGAIYVGIKGSATAKHDNTTLSTLELSSAKLSQFLNYDNETITDGETTVKDGKGQVSVGLGGRIHLTDSNQVEISQFAFNNKAGAGHINVEGIDDSSDRLQDSTAISQGFTVGDKANAMDGTRSIVANNMSIGKSLIAVSKDTATTDWEHVKSGNSSYAFRFEANDLTLGSDKGTLNDDTNWNGFDSKTKIGAHELKAHKSITFIDGRSDTFYLQDDVVLDTTLGSDTILGTANDSNTGTLKGDDVVIGYDNDTDSSTSGSLTVAGGAWTTEQGQSIKVADGRLTVSAQAGDLEGTGDDSYYAGGVATSLTINGGSFIINKSDNASAEPTVTVSGAKGATALLDLRNTSVTWGSGSVTITGASERDSKNDILSKAGEGQVFITGAQFNAFINTTGTNASETKLLLGADGVLFADGTISGDIDVSKFASGTTAANAGTVYFSGGGTFATNGQLSIAADDANEVLAIGAGNISAQSLTLNNKGIEDKYKSDLDKDIFIVSGGTLEVTNGLSSSNSVIEFKNNGNNAGRLILDTDENNASGLINTNLRFNETAPTSGDYALEVEQGQWAMAEGKDAYFAGGANFKVGADPAEFELQGATAALSLDNLNVTDASSNLVAEGGSLTVNTMQAGEKATFMVQGQFTINGRSDIVSGSASTEIDVVKKAANTAGIDLADAEFTVSGPKAQLKLGNVATKTLVQITAAQLEGSAKTTVKVDKAIDDAIINLEDHGMLYLDFDSGTTITAQNAKDLKSALITNIGNGILNVGSGSLDIKWDHEDTLTTSWDSVKEFANVQGVTSDKLMSTLIDEVAVGTVVSGGQYGAIQTDFAAPTALQVDGNLGLHQARGENGGYFVFSTNAAGEQSAVGVDLVADSTLLLDGAGKIGAIGGTTGTELVITQGMHSGAAVGTTEILGAIKGVESVEVGNDTTVAGNIEAGELRLEAGTNLTNVFAGTAAYDTVVTTADVFANASFSTQNFTLDARNGRATGYNDSWIMGSVEVGDTLKLQSNQVGDLVDAEGNAVHANELIIAGGTVKAQNTVLDSGAAILVGLDAQTRADNDAKDGIDKSAAYTGAFETQSLDLNGGALIVDPDLNHESALASVKAMVDASTVTGSKVLGTLDGSILVGQNAAVGMGTNDLAALREVIAQYQVDGKLVGGADHLGSILYLDGITTLSAGEGIAMTGLSQEAYQQRLTQNGKTVTADGVLADSVYFGAQSALLISADAMNYIGEEHTNALVTFSSKDGKLIADGGEILIAGDLRATSYQIFADGDNRVVVEDLQGNESKIEVSTDNGFLIGTLSSANGADGGKVTLTVNEEARYGSMAGASDPVYASLVAYAQGYNGKDADGNPVDPLYNGFVKDQVDADGNPVKNTDYRNKFLSDVISMGYGADAEAAARLAVYGGAPQAAIKAGQSSTDAIAARFGIGSALSNLTVAGNTQGAALWLAPVYKTSDSDGFDAQGVDYGVNVDLYGVALGADYTLANGMSFGAMFNVGSGEVDGEGAASSTSNDFDYYGFGAYVGYTMGQFSVVGDVSYTVADNEVEASTSVDHIGAQMDSTNLSLGVTGKYELSFNGVNVTPHVGLRYSNIDLDDYTIDGEEVVASADSDKLNLFSIPVGVTIAKEFKGESWTVAPSFDLTLTGQFGDDELDGSVSWAGVENLSTDTTTEVFDNFTYGATLGVEAQSAGGVALGINVGYTGSSNVDEFGVNANARFVF